MVSFCSTVLFPCASDHRDLHSFPTRRSSDLCFFAPGLTAIIAELAPLLIGRDPREIQRLVQDRKSTRLNSSHLGISYAVFCLKKKNFLFSSHQAPYR